MPRLVPLHRYHGPRRSLDDFIPGQVIVTTYGTLLRDADRLAAIRWDIVVADEAQQVKNHRSQAARALRSIPAGADRGDRHTGRELAVRAMGHPGLDESRAVRNPHRLP